LFIRLTFLELKDRVAIRLEKLRNFTLVREKSGILWFVCDVLLQL